MTGKTLDMLINGYVNSICLFCTDIIILPFKDLASTMCSIRHHPDIAEQRLYTLGLSGNLYLGSTACEVRRKSSTKGFHCTI